MTRNNVFHELFQMIVYEEPQHPTVHVRKNKNTEANMLSVTFVSSTGGSELVSVEIQGLKKPKCH